jgi:hypothetical protein
MRVSDEDLIRIYGDRYDPWKKTTKKNKVVGVYYWGDDVDLIDEAEADDPLIKKVRVRYYNYALGKHSEGYIKKKSAGRQRGRTHYQPFQWRTGSNPHLLETTFIDVQQGDATLIRTPDPPDDSNRWWGGKICRQIIGFSLSGHDPSSSIDTGRPGSHAR